MKEEHNSKSKWTRIFRKKWFFPAVYLTVAALLLTGVVWYQNLDNQMPGLNDDEDDIADNYVPDPFDEDADPVVDQDEIIRMPVSEDDQAEIVTKFYDYNAEEADRQQALIHHNNSWYQSTGIDIATSAGESFDVMASLSGTVEGVKQDPLLGNVVTLSHGNDVKTYYASLDDVSVKKGDKLEQGAVIGTAGKNLFGKENGIHVHFELHKGEQKLNPEAYFNQPVSKMDVTQSDETESDDDTEASSTNDSMPDTSDDVDDEPDNEDNDAE
ncbi:M23 family metallopeptidase [Lentibacillus saliphilus]|uniref:M23 family metallopeptidase n=1 Tax=Lentibacillus saliphilus TaxID=2737028 RepID=UPI001C2F87EB|nr:M23 family metallopeptidase [Lentibacillus saliphilus]